MAFERGGRRRQAAEDGSLRPAHRTHFQQCFTPANELSRGPWYHSITTGLRLPVETGFEAKSSTPRKRMLAPLPCASLERDQKIQNNNCVCPNPPQRNL